MAMATDALFDVAGETVVITGASGQMGRSYARAFLERGARVAALDVRESSELAALLKGHRDRGAYFAASVTDRAQLDASLVAIEARFGAPTVLVNNAALDSPPSAPAGENGPYESYPESSWDAVVDVNLTGVHLCCQVFGSAMARAGRGSIINIASIYGLVSPDQSLYEYRRARGETFFKPVAYSASKAGVLNLTRYLAVYWARQGVRVNSLTLAGVFNDQDQAFLDVYCDRIPIGRMARATEYDGTVLFLASSASTYMTGANLVVDGGWTAI